MKDYEIKDIGELVAILSERDPRTLEEMAATDEHYDDLTVREAQEPQEWGHDGPFHGRTQEVAFEGSSMGTFPVWSPIDEQEHIIKAGDVLRCFGWPGGSRYGHAINGELVVYQTRFERFAWRMKMLAGFDRDKRIRRAKSKEEAERLYAGLSDPFRTRMDRFKAKDPEFIFDMMYEMIPCAIADEIINYVNVALSTSKVLTIEDGIKAFKELSHDEQREVIGENLYAGISGHQFDSAVGLAWTVLDGQSV